MLHHEKIRFRDYYCGRLILTSPFHTGASAVNALTDAPLLRDAGGRFYIPGTSIAGALRAYCCRVFGSSAAARIFGKSEKNDKTENETIYPSLIRIEDAYPENPEFLSAIRDGVGIDRKTGTALDGAKYDLEITPKNLALSLTILFEPRTDCSESEIQDLRSQVFHLMKAFEEGKIKLGAEKSRGLGACCFEHEWRVLDCENSAQLRAFLCAQNWEEKWTCLQEGDVSAIGAGRMQPEALQSHEIGVAMSVEDTPFLIKSGDEGEEIDAVFVKVWDENGQEVDCIPGSSIKGVFRERAEKILRTLGGWACPVVDKEESCNNAIKNRIAQKQLEKGQITWEDRKTIIEENSCPVCQLFGNSYMAGRLRFNDAFFETGQQKKQQDHVAIDRFTGGAAGGKLFNEEPVVSGKTEFHMTLDNPTDFDKALLLFIFRDLMTGFPPLRFGYGKMKGFGRLTPTELALDGCRTHVDEIDLTRLFGDQQPVMQNWWQKAQKEAST